MFFVIASCASNETQTTSSSIPAPDIGLPIPAPSDSYLELTAPKGWNTFKTDESITLMVSNISDKQIIVDQDFGARIFVFNNDSWVEIGNKGIYADGPIIILEPNKKFSPEKIGAAFVLPDLPDISVPSYVKIFILGSVFEDEKKIEDVVSYIDIELTP